MARTTRTTTSRLLAAAAALVAVLPACQSPMPAATDAPTPGPGTFRGPVMDVKGYGGAGVLTLGLTSTGAISLGTWALDLSQGAYTNQGTVTGSISGGRVQLVLSPADPKACHFAIQATAAAEDHITGAWSEISCTSPFGGSLDLRRQ